MDRYPNLFLIGVPKCGTTSLYRYISVHPDIFAPEKKEPNYLIYENLKAIGARRKKLDNAVSSTREYLDLYKDANEKYLLDGTIFTYLFTDAMDAIRKISPDYKALVILRDPVGRFISHYKMSYNLGDVKTGIEEYIRNPICGMGTNTLEMGLYGVFLERVFKVLGRDRVHVVLLDDLITDRNAALGEVYDFLGLPYYQSDEDDTKHLSSPGKARSAFLRNIYFDNSIVSGLKDILRKTPLYKLKKTVNDRLFEQWRPSGETIGFLHEYYLKDIEKTEDILGRSLDEWKVYG